MKMHKKHVVSIALVVALLLGCIGYADVTHKSTAVAKEPDFVINTLQELVSFLDDNCDSGKLVALNSNIDCGGISLPKLSGLSGTFDGCGHTISNANTSALFDWVGEDGVVCNLILSDSRIKQIKDYEDSIAGIANINYGVINNCGVVNCELSTDYDVGGIVCKNRDTGTVINCFSSSNYIEYGRYVGGIVAENDGSVYNSCSSSVLHNCDYGECKGGIVGWLCSGVVENCYSVGPKDNGGSRTGGIAGQIEKKGKILNCYVANDTAAHPVESVVSKSSEIVCKYLSESEMESEEFRERLNSNRISNTDKWSEWVFSNYSNCPIPMFPPEESFDSAVIPSVTSAPEPTVAPVATSTPTPTFTDTTSSSVKNAYKKYIKKHAYNWWAIKDFNGDGQPELICDYSFLHYKNGKVRDVKYKGVAKEWVVNLHHNYYYSKKKCIGISFSNSRWNGTAIVKYNGKFLKTILLETDVREGSHEYYVGNKKVSKSVYDKKLKRYNASGKKKIKLTYVS